METTIVGENVDSMTNCQQSQASSSSSIISLDKWNAAHEAIDGFVVLCQTTRCQMTTQSEATRKFATRLAEEHYPFYGDNVLLAMIVNIECEKQFDEMLENLNVIVVPKEDISTGMDGQSEGGVVLQLLVYEWNKKRTRIIRFDGAKTANFAYTNTSDFLNALSSQPDEGQKESNNWKMQMGMLQRDWRYVENLTDVRHVKIALARLINRISEANANSICQSLKSTINALNRTRGKLTTRQKRELQMALKDASWLPRAVKSEKVALKDIETSAREIRSDSKVVAEFKASIEAKKLTTSTEMNKFVLLSVVDVISGEKRLIPIDRINVLIAHQQMDTSCGKRKVDCAILEYDDCADVEQLICRARVQSQRISRTRRDKLDEAAMIETYRNFFASISEDGSLKKLMSRLSSRELRSMLQPEFWNKVSEPILNRRSKGDLVLAATLDDELLFAITDLSRACGDLKKNSFQLHTECWITTMAKAIKRGVADELSLANNLRNFLKECKDGKRILTKVSVEEEIIEPLKDSHNPNRRSRIALKRGRDVDSLKMLFAMEGMGPSSPSLVQSFDDDENAQSASISQSTDQSFDDGDNAQTSSNSRGRKTLVKNLRGRHSCASSPINRVKSPGFASMTTMSQSHSPPLSPRAYDSDNTQFQEPSVKRKRLKKPFRPPLLNDERDDGQCDHGFEEDIPKRNMTIGDSSGPSEKDENCKRDDRHFVKLIEDGSIELRKSGVGVYIVKITKGIWKTMLKRIKRSNIDANEIELVATGDIANLTFYAVLPHNVELVKLQTYWLDIAELKKKLECQFLGIALSDGDSSVNMGCNGNQESPEE